MTYTTPEGAAWLCADDLTSEMIAEQIRLEESMAQRGYEQFQREVNGCRQRGTEDETNYGAVLMLHRVGVVAQAIRDFLTASDTGKAGKRHLAAKPLRELDPDTTAFLALKSVVSGLTVSRTAQAVCTSIGTMVEDEIRLRAVREAEAKAWKSIQTGIKNRNSLAFKRAYAIRQAIPLESRATWDRVTKMHVGAKLLDIIVSCTGIVQITTESIGRNSTKKMVSPTEETMKWIDRRIEAAALLRPVYEPMVVPPRDWTGAWGGGYLTSNIAPMPLIKVRNAGFLEDLDSADMPIVYEAVNAIQRTPWQINAEVMGVMNTLWDRSSTLAGLPPREGIEPPPKPLDIATNEEARRQWRIAAAKVRQRNMSSKGSRIAVNMALTLANRYAKYPEIYFPAQFDFRGRVYSVTTLSPQGSDTTKALLRFANGKPLGETGAQWLAYQGANLAGNDKVSFEERVQWVLDNEEEIYACAKDPYENLGWCTEIGGVEIDSPWQFLAFCFEWAGYLEQGESFVSRIPVAMDGSCSGIQHFSAMLKDASGGAAVNLVPSERPQDVYGIVAKAVIERLNKDAEEGTEDTQVTTADGKSYVLPGTKSYAKQWLEFGVTRKVTKRSVMTLAYGSKQYGFHQQLIEDIVQPAMDAATDAAGVVDRHAFPFEGDGYKAAGYMAKCIWDAVSVTLVAAVDAMKWLQEAASLAAQENLPVRWTTPVGFPVMQAYQDTRDRTTKTILAGKIAQLTMKDEQPTLDTKKMANGISPNFVHSCDAAHLMLTVARATQAGITNFAMVHDSFGTTAADLEVFYTTVREAFVEIYTGMDVLANFKEDVEAILSPDSKEKLRGLPAHGTLDVAGVLTSRYCFS